MATGVIYCKKYHYSVPETYLRIDACITLNKKGNKIIVYNVDGDKNVRLKRLDKIEMKIKLDEIQGFIYGSFSTRFWMMRRGINT